ncbi:MAG TPA: hypothetical protein V6C84_19250 [Coleofasciculaceae cyanobacterium]
MAIFNVTNTNDSGAGSLRDAIAQANATTGLDSIAFTGAVFTDTTLDTIALTSGQLDVTDSLMLQGTGATLLTLSGNNTSRIFNITAADATLDGLTIANGNAVGSGGGILYLGTGALTIKNSTLLNNKVTGASGSNGGDGGGGGGGGGAGLGGSLYSEGGTVTVSNSTISGGQAIGGNGGNAALSNGLSTGIGATGGGAAGGTGGTGSAAGSLGGFGSGGGGGAGNTSGGGAGGAGGFGGGSGGGGAVNGLSGTGSSLGGNGGVGGATESGAGGGGAGLGGGIFMRSGTLKLDRTTFTNNATQAGIGGVSGVTNGSGLAGQSKAGAVFLGAGATASSLNTTFTGSVAVNDAGSPTDNDDVFGTIASLPYLASLTPTSLLNGTSIGYTATFSEAVTGVNLSDFSLATTGTLAGAAISSVQSVSDTVYTVAVNTGVGAGDLNLKLVDDDSIASKSGQVLGGVGSGNADFSAQAYTIDRSALTVQIIQVKELPFGLAKKVGGIKFKFSKVVAGFDLSDLRLSVKGKLIALTGATLTTTDNITWTLDNLESLTQELGEYQISIASGSFTNVVSGSTLDISGTWLTGVVGFAPRAIVFKGGKKGVQRSGGKEGDFIISSCNNDILLGGDGDDRLFGGFKLKGFGNDRLSGGNGDDYLDGGRGRDFLEGGNGKDKLKGGKRSDQLQGDDDDDELIGQEGNDVLVGGDGEDVLSGGRGRDVFVCQSVKGGNDRVTDFKVKTDLLDLREIFVLKEFSALTAFAQFTEYVKLVKVGSDTQVRIDADGIGSSKTFVSVMTLEKVTTTSISAQNFVIS